MPTDVVFPKVSLESDRGRIARWLVKDGDTVEQGAVLFEIDDDKATVEVEAPASGIVRQAAGNEDEIRVGQCVARVFAAGEPVSASDETTSPSEPAPARESAVSQDPVRRSDESSRSGRVIATPLARRLAAEGNIDLSAVRGSGPHGRIQKRDMVGLPARDASPAATHGVKDHGLHAAWLQSEGAGTAVMIHGFGSDLNSWRSLLIGGRLPARVLALDLPAHGKSSSGIPGDLDAICEMIEDRLAGERIEGATLVGHSFGGAVAARLASRGRIVARSMLLIAPAGLGPDINGAFIAGFPAAKQPASIKPWLDLLVHDPAVLPRALLRSVEEQRRDADRSRALADFGSRHFADGTQTFSIRDDLERVRIPTRVIFGVEDRIIPLAHARGLPGHVGLHAFRACGHLPYLEQPEQTLRILDEMIRLAG